MFSLLLCATTWLGYAQNPKQENLLAPLYATKKVKSVTAWLPSTTDEKSKAFYQEYNAQGKLTFELVYSEQGEIIKKYQSFFSADNRLLKEVWTMDATDSVSYKYKNGKLTEESWYWGADKSRTRVVHFYDSLSQKTCTVSKNSWGVYVDSFFYQNGRLHQTKNYNENGLLTSITEQVYDSKGRPTKVLLKDENGATLQTTHTAYWETGPVKSSETLLYSTMGKNTTAPSVSASMAENYKYDAAKQLKEVNINSFTNNEQLVNTKITYVYNEKGLPANQTTVNVITNTKQNYRFTYTFF